MTLPTVEEYQKVFADNLLSEQLSITGSEKILAHIVPLYSEMSKDTEAYERFTIYRNNVILSLNTAIADTFPVVKRLLGDKLFDAAAIDFVRKNPPQQPALLFYGEGFINFIKHYPPCTEFQYLSDIAQLEWHTVKAFHAADAEIKANLELAEIDPEIVTTASFVLHPSVVFIQSKWPIDTIWEENQKQQVSILNLDNYSASNLLIYRRQNDQQVQVVNLTLDCFYFAKALSEGMNITDAWEHTLGQQQDELDNDDLAGMLGYLLSLSIFTSVVLPSKFNN